MVSLCALLVALGCGSDEQPGRMDGESGRAGSGDPFSHAGATASGSAGSSGSAGHGASGSPAAGATGSAGMAGPAPGSGPAEVCADTPSNQLPDELRCAGLYADIATKKLASTVRAFKPATELWSDGASKQRWVYLPPGMKIDNSDPNSWIFPIGTRFFKEFSSGGKRVETRVFWKEGDRHWLKATYHWSTDEASATRFDGGMVDAAGKPYFIPSAKECDRCHNGRVDRTLGFEQVLLALDGATGLTLQELIRAGLLTNPPSGSSFSLGDDGTGKAAPALRWLHVNCGVGCHNNNTDAEGYTSDLRLRLPAEAIDGRSPAMFDSLRTTIRVATTTPEWRGRTRIVPGNPRNSLLYSLASTRNLTSPDNQMPPVASRVVDSQGVMLLDAWIKAIR